MELCIYNQYHPICGNVWTSTEATVACRKLGYNSGLYLYIVGTDNSFWLRRKQMSIAMVQAAKEYLFVWVLQQLLQYLDHSQQFRDGTVLVVRAVAQRQVSTYVIGTSLITPALLHIQVLSTALIHVRI